MFGDQLHHQKQLRPYANYPINRVVGLHEHSWRRVSIALYQTATRHIVEAKCADSNLAGNRAWDPPSDPDGGSLHLVTTPLCALGALAVQDRDETS